MRFAVAARTRRRRRREIRRCADFVNHVNGIAKSPAAGSGAGSACPRRAGPPIPPPFAAVSGRLS